MERRLYYFYLSCFILILFLPLFASQVWFFPSPWGKSILFKIILSVILVVFCYQFLFLKREKVKGPFWPLLFLALLSFFYLLSTVFSQDPYLSFWGEPQRAGGSLNLFLFVVFSVLAFKIIKKKDWKIIWDTSIIVGIIVSFLAVLQKFDMAPDFIRNYSHRVFSTIGNPLFLALYLIPLTFIALSFAVKKINKKSFFYFFALCLFILVIILTASRSAFLGLFAGLAFFVFFYPKKLAVLKVAVGALILVSILAVLWLNSQPNLVLTIKENRVFGTAFDRAWQTIDPVLKEPSLKNLVSQGRYAVWQTIYPGIKEKPLLGFGPENAYIAFNKYYDPSVPGITTEAPKTGTASGWADRAHNFILDIAVSAGILALIAYLGLITSLFIKTEHGIRAAFIAYLTANLFVFDVFSTYLIFFLMVAYSLSLIKKEKEIVLAEEESLKKYLALAGFFFLAVWFVWNNFDALWVNKRANEAKRQSCEGVEIMDEIIQESTFIDSYICSKYIEIVDICLKEKINPLVLYNKSLPVLEKAIEKQPNNVRNYLNYASFTSGIIQTDKSLTQEQKQELAEKAYLSLEKARELSPKRNELFLILIQTHLSVQDFQKALNTANECLMLGDCWWSKALILTKQGKIAEAKETIKQASDKNYSQYGKNNVLVLNNIYSKLAIEKKDPDYLEILDYLQKELTEME